MADQTATRRGGRPRLGLIAAGCALLVVVGAGSAGWAQETMVLGGADAATAAPPSPITVQAVDQQTEDGPVRGFVATVDLTDPRVEIVVTDPVDGTLDPPEAEAVLTPTDTFVQDTGCVLGFNANFFSWLADPDGNKTLADVIGLSISDGRVISGPRSYEGRSDPAIVFSKQPRARVMILGQADLQAGEVWDGVAGIGGSGSTATPGTLLVQDGVNLGNTARVGPQTRHPRTAAGVNADGTLLIVAVIDGRQPEHSIGINLPDLADLMIKHGADDALNLDGGGSSAFVCWGPAATGPAAQGDGWITNSPSDGRFRAVANSVGVRLEGWTPPQSTE